MIASRKIIADIQKRLKAEIKEPHAISQPVLREEGGKTYIGLFVFMITREDVENGRIHRPAFYCLCDLETGELSELIDCAKKDFCGEPSDRTYGMELPEGVAVDEAFYDEAYKLLDRARQTLLEIGPVREFGKIYAAYYNRIVSSVPKDYIVFYKELSKPPKTDAPAVKKAEGENSQASSGQKQAQTSEKKTAARMNDRNETQKPQASTLKAETDTKQETGSEKPVREEGRKSDDKELSCRNERKETKAVKEEEEPAKPQEAEEKIKEKEKTEGSLHERYISLISRPKIIEPGTVREAGKDKEEKKEEAVPIQALTNGFRWEPKKGLSIVPEKYYSIYEKIAEKMEFLPCDEEGTLRYSYPLYCYKKDRSEGKEKWQDLQEKLKNGTLPFGHYRIKGGDSIFVRCVNAEGCLFGSCPYIAAAYIKYLKENDPERLQEERAEYASRRFETDAKYQKRPDLKIRIPKDISNEALLAGYRFVCSGRLSVEQDGEDYRCAWQQGRDEKMKVITVRIKRAELESESFQPTAVMDGTGRKIPAHIGYAILADYMSRLGLLEEAVKDIIQKEKEGAAGKEEMSAAPARPEAAKEKTPIQAEYKEKPEVKPEEKQPVKNEPKAATKVNPITFYTDKKSFTSRAITDTAITSFYGCLITTPTATEKEMAPSLMEALKRAGKAGGSIVELTPYELSELTVRKEDLYVIIGIDEFVHAAEENRGSLEVLKAGSALKRFEPGCHVVLSGRTEVLQALFNLIPTAKNIYGRIVLREKGPDMKTMFERFVKALPEALKAQVSDETFKEWQKWMNQKVRPVPAENLPEWLAWQCALEGRIRFKVYAERKEGQA